MVHFIIVNWFHRSGVQIWNRFRGRLKWILWRVNLNITIINGIMINYSHDSWNHRTGFGRRGPGFEVNCLRLSIPFSWCIKWFITSKGVELVHFYSKTWWEEIRAKDDSGISLVSNSFTEFGNNVLSNAKSCNKCLESCCIIVDEIRRTKMTIVLNWSVQCTWGYNHLKTTIESTNIYPCESSWFYIVVKEYVDILHLGCNECI